LLRATLLQHLHQFDDAEALVRASPARSPLSPFSRQGWLNLGLEVAQLAVVGWGVALLWRPRRWPGHRRWMQGLGTVWVWQRVAS
jgi:hypothetical protein